MTVSGFSPPQATGLLPESLGALAVARRFAPFPVLPACVSLRYWTRCTLPAHYWLLVPREVVPVGKSGHVPCTRGAPLERWLFSATHATPRWSQRPSRRGQRPQARNGRDGCRHLISP